MRISVIGLGYVGAVSAACLARRGHDVIGVDVNPQQGRAGQRGEAPVLEPGLPEAIAEATASGRLRATTTPPRPSGPPTSRSCASARRPGSQGSLDLAALERVCADIGPALRDHERRHTVVVRSTVLPGTTEETRHPGARAELRAQGAARDFGVAMNPEYLREGSGVADFDNPEKTVIGQLDAASGDAVAEMYGASPGPDLPRADPRRGGGEVRRQRVPRAEGRLRERGRRAERRVRRSTRTS